MIQKSDDVCDDENVDDDINLALWYDSFLCVDIGNSYESTLPTNIFCLSLRCFRVYI